ncbi:hypothetical protein CHGG_05183 [Chaetomium globosum CBS 148.51]|uniref:Uncharacterized protein n=1 Tax=Chaetomium globosum (strain ATCC 6205 / CBS 148.51 / DSM 1962 / NBRC 6347 / NRRL 1970) TaxID=306901 RepID=Q2GZ63_CHAGB|nr:uncharacterized protein CHGG_05183 [Chaetomium globosum CBS 148.51]EAQ88564.1 hypothetical protein CHGG_05183 [Chaetomium globosum CBS 148.51]
MRQHKKRAKTALAFAAHSSCGCAGCRAAEAVRGVAAQDTGIPPVSRMLDIRLSARLSFRPHKPPREPAIRRTAATVDIQLRTRPPEDAPDCLSMAAQTVTELRTHSRYTVGWVCALPKEQTAATAMLDDRHPDLPKPPNDDNTYTLGSIAAAVAARMVGTFPSVKVGLMVGIGDGIPPKVRLGDVVVSSPVGQFPGVVQWDFGKAMEGAKFERTGSLNNPPTSLRTALTKLETENELSGSKIPEYLDELKEKWPRLAPKYLRSGSLEDVLFRADYDHVSERSSDCDVTLDSDDEDEEEESCRFCDRAKIVKRKPREMRVHYGLIASGNQVIKDATFRGRLNMDLGGSVLCVEMEAAGLMNNFPCLVIRGICAYADSHKNKDWQEHAAAVAAAFAKELLGYVQTSDVDGERPVKDILAQVSKIQESVAVVTAKMKTKEELHTLNWLTSVDYADQHNDFIRRRQEGTGQWLLDSAEFQAWLNTDKQTLFCPGIPGAGKTLITAIVINHLQSRFRDDQSTGIAYIYCNFQRQDGQKPEDLLAQFLLAQLHIDMLLSQLTKGDLKRALQSLGKGMEGLEKTYDQAMERIERQGRDHADRAKQILTWIVHSKRPLSVLELQHALAVQANTAALDTDFIPTAEVMLSLCAGLVTIDEESSVIRLAHYTTQEYFQQSQKQWVLGAVADIATRCVTYLSFDTFQNGSCPTHAEFEQRLRSNPLYKYAAQNWGHYAREALTSNQSVAEYQEDRAKVEALIISFLETAPKVEASSQAMLYYGFKIERTMAGLHLAAYFGLANVTEALINNGHGVDSPDHTGRTPLSWAIAGGRTAVVKLLLERGANVDCSYRLILLLTKWSDPSVACCGNKGRNDCWTPSRPSCSTRLSGRRWPNAAITGYSGTENGGCQTAARRGANVDCSYRLSRRIIMLSKTVRTEMAKRRYHGL